jgi:hypothetical protein
MRHAFAAPLPLLAVTLALLPVAGCASASLPLPPNTDWHRYGLERGNEGDERSLRLRPEVCDGRDLRPDYEPLNEASFIRFLQEQRYDVQAQRQEVDPKNPELHYVFVTIPGIAGAVPLRVAVLPTADDAGRSLHEALLARGSGWWGVHRSNVAVLGPPGASTDDLAFAAFTKLACWGTFTVAGVDDAFVVSGGYAEP